MSDNSCEKWEVVPECILKEEAVPEESSPGGMILKEEAVPECIVKEEATPECILKEEAVPEGMILKEEVVLEESTPDDSPPAQRDEEKAMALKENTRRLLSIARAGKPQKKGRRTRPEGAAPVKRQRNRSRHGCSLAPCKGDILYYNLKRHLEHVMVR